MRRQGKSQSETEAFFGNKSNGPSIIKRAYNIPMPISDDDAKMFSFSTFGKCLFRSQPDPCDKQTMLASTAMEIRLKGVSQSNAGAQIKHMEILAGDSVPESISTSIIGAAYSAPMPKSHDDSIKFALQTKSQCLWKRGIIASEIGSPCIIQAQMAETAMRSRMQGNTQAQTLVSFGINADAPAIVQKVYSEPMATSNDDAKKAGANAMISCTDSELARHKPTKCDAQMSVASTVMSMRESGLSHSEVEARLAQDRPGSDNLSAVPGSAVSAIVAVAYSAPLVVKPEDVTTAPSNSPYGEFVRQLPAPMLAAYSFAEQTCSRCIKAGMK